MFWLDLTYVWRQVRTTPGYFVLIAATIGLGVAATTLVWTVVYALVLKPLPYRDPSRLVLVSQDHPHQAIERSPVSPATFLNHADHPDLFESTAAVTSCVPFSLSDGGRVEELTCQMATPALFETLGVAPLLGRAFAERDRSSRVVIISHALWRRWFSQDPGAIGRNLQLSGTSHEVIGVLPEGFELLNSGTDVWVPLHLHASARQQPNRYLAMIARLKDTQTAAAAESALDASMRHTPIPVAAGDEGWEIRVKPLHDEILRRSRPAIDAAVVTVSLAMALVCCNAAFLGAGRRRARLPELVTRLSVGASPWDLARLVWCELIVVGMLSGGVAALASFYGFRLLSRIGFALPDMSRLGELGAAQRVAAPVILGFVLAIALACVALAARPWGAGSLSSQSELTLRDRHVGGGPVRAAILVSQTSLAVMFAALAVGAAERLRQLQAVPLGFDSANVLTARVVLSPSAYSPGRRVQFVTDLLHRIEQIPGVEAAAVIRGLPMSAPFGARASWFAADQSASWDGLRCRLAGTAIEQPQVNAVLRLVTPDYFTTLRIPLRSGRTFDLTEYNSRRSVAVVSRSLETKLAGDGPAPVRALTCEGLTPGAFEIIGTVGDVHDRSPDVPAEPTVYLPYTREPLSAVAIAIRTRVPPAGIGGRLSDAVRAADGMVPLTDVRTMPDRVAETTTTQRLLRLCFQTCAALTVLMAVVGIHGIAQYELGRRRAEYALRMVLGAAPSSVARLLVSRIVILAACGVLAGSWGAIVCERLFVASPLLGGTSALLIHGLVGCSVLATVLATCVPAVVGIYAIQPTDMLKRP